MHKILELCTEYNRLCKQHDLMHDMYDGYMAGYASYYTTDTVKDIMKLSGVSCDLTWSAGKRIDVNLEIGADTIVVRGGGNSVFVGLMVDEYEEDIREMLESYPNLVTKICEKLKMLCDTLSKYTKKMIKDAHREEHAIENKRTETKKKIRNILDIISQGME